MVFGTLVAVSACGPNLEPAPVMTPEERLRAEEMKAYQQEQEGKKRGGDENFVAEDEPEVFDKKQAEMELRRASLSAATCGDVVGDKSKKGIAHVNIVFASDGSVREATVEKPYGDGDLGACILNAYKAVIVPPFKEAEFAMPWELDLSGKAKGHEADDLERKIFGGGDDNEDEDEKSAKNTKKK